jgi:hypothetical protein
VGPVKTLACKLGLARDLGGLNVRKDVVEVHRGRVEDDLLDCRDWCESRRIMTVAMLVATNQLLYWQPGVLN